MYINLTDDSDNIFHTIQGEGKYIGYPCTFVRLSRCNLKCEWANEDGTHTRCDTPHTSFDPVIEKHLITDIVNKVNAFGAKHAIVSGGEPYFQKSVTDLINILHETGHYVTVETNGTIYRESKADYISISPKLSSSSMSEEYGKRHEKQRYKPDSLFEFITNHDYQFKFVINTQRDILEVVDIVNAMASRGVDITDNIWLMPQGITPEQFDDKMKWLAEVCKDKNWKLTDRLHIRIWGAKKGV